MIQREIFGPVITVQPFSDEEQAIEWANGRSTVSPRRSGRVTSGRALRVVEGAALRLRVDQRPHPVRLRDAARRLQGVRLRQGSLDVLARGLHGRQARDGQPGLAAMDERRAEADRLAGLGVLRVTGAQPRADDADRIQQLAARRRAAGPRRPGPRPRSEHAPPSRRLLEERGGPSAILLTHAHADHAGALDGLRARFPAAPVYAGAARLGGRPLGDGRADRAADARSRPPATAPTTSRSSATASASPATRCSAKAASSWRPARTRWRATSRRFERLAQTPSWPCICPGHGPAVFEPRAKLLELHRSPPRTRAAPASRRSTPGCARTDELLGQRLVGRAGGVAARGGGHARGPSREARRRRAPARRRRAPAVRARRLVGR